MNLLTVLSIIFGLIGMGFGAIILLNSFTGTVTINEWSGIAVATTAMFAGFLWNRKSINKIIGCNSTIHTTINSIERTVTLICDKVDDLSEVVFNLKEAMIEYKAINYDVPRQEIEEVRKVINYSSTYSCKIIRDYVLQFKDCAAEPIPDFAVQAVGEYIMKEREKAHRVDKGFSVRTIKLWEEVESELFKGFSYDIIQATKTAGEIVKKMNGHGEMLLDVLFKNLQNEWESEFMRRFKSKLIEKERT